MTFLRRLFHRHRPEWTYVTTFYVAHSDPVPKIVDECRCGVVRINPSGKWEKR